MDTGRTPQNPYTLPHDCEIEHQRARKGHKRRLSKRAARDAIHDVMQKSAAHLNERNCGFGDQ